MPKKVYLPQDDRYCQYEKWKGRTCGHWATKQIVINDLDHGLVSATSKRLSVCDTHYLVCMVNMAADATKGQIFG